jgi:peptidoglycan/xylan/chitin deacetylase (PgdA/CDA1 family)
MNIEQRARRYGLLTFAGLWMAACAFGQSSSTPGQSVAGADNVFADLRKEWASNLRDKNVGACVAEYAPDAEFVQPDGASVRGSAAIGKLYETITATFDSNLVFDSKQLESAGDDAIDSGSYREVRQLYTGGYRTVYHRDKDGHWLIVKMAWIGSGDPIALDLDPHPVVALTFDDLPAAGTLPAGKTRAEIAEMLTGELMANHMAGTYGFVNAKKLEGNPDAEKALHIWVDAGMNIGSHTWSHPGLTSEQVFKPLPVEEYIADVARNEPALAEYGQLRDWKWFRYPFLEEGDTVEKRRAVRKYLFEHGYRIAQVTLDFEDYAWNDAYARCAATKDTVAIDWLRQSYLETATEYIRLGREEQLIAFGHEIPNVMLLHATAFTTLMLPDLLQLLRGQGFSFEGLAQVENDSAYSLDPDAGLKYGGTLPDQFMDSRHLPYPPVKPKPLQQLAHLCQ